TAATGKNPYIIHKATKRGEIAMRAYLKARAEGDKNVYFIDGYAARGFEVEEGTVDGGHPTDSGFNNMAKSMYPLLRKLIYND
ncbi:MAG: hypothetical protein IKM67_00830, partial [Clostridia bacterium]|nr:hypothetical protein [Clostridia bacterium]